MKQATKTVTWAVACCSLVAAFEGCDFTAKKDMIGTGHPPTWCHGETIGNVKVGQKFTKAQCDAMLAVRLPSYWAAIEPGIKVETSDNEKIAYTSFAYNVGSGAFLYSNRKKKTPSAILRHLNAGDHAGACNSLMQFTHAQGVVVRGLVNRRAAERKICLTPDSAPSVQVRNAVIIPLVKEMKKDDAVKALPTSDGLVDAAAPNISPVSRPDYVAPPKPEPRVFSYDWWMAA